MAKVNPDPEANQDNYCYQKNVWENIEKMHREAPNDTLVTRMWATRRGICALIEEGKITLDEGTAIFELERSRAVIERHQEETRKKRKVGA